MLIDLELMKWKDALSFSNTPDGRYIFCLIRRRFYVSTPEELVRQLLLQWLTKEAKYSKSLINIEKSISVNGLFRRFDIVVYNSDGSPEILIECKAPKVKLQQSTFDQVAAYNIQVKAPYLVISNGIGSYCAKIDFKEKSFSFLEKVPIKS